MNKQPHIEAGVVQVGANNETADNLIELIKALVKVDTNAPKAKINETSISDNNGGRILL